MTAIMAKAASICISAPHHCYKAYVAVRKNSPRCHFTFGNFCNEMNIKSDPRAQIFKAFFPWSSCDCFIRHFHASSQGVMCLRAPHSLTPIYVQTSLSQQAVPCIRHCLELSDRHRNSPTVVCPEKEVQLPPTGNHHFMSWRNFSN